ncbi:50S ribosomal protein L14 [Candidatus Pacearchaeota archaeon]|nr:50S ribosomal protein L14 [Candidatus Pacearchaeota archaeon]
MKAVSAKPTKGLNVGSQLISADNSGAKIVRIVAVKKAKAKKGKQTAAKIADWVKVSVKKGIPDMKGEVFDAVVIRQKKPYRRLNGERVAFEDNAAVILKDEKGNPKGTQVKGPVAREILERWPQVAKIASIIY